jgi:hypothetical protein
MGQTIVRQLSYANPASAGLPALELPSTNEQAVFNNAALTHWFRADYGVETDGWTDRKSDQKLLVGAGKTMPTEQTIAAYNNLPSLYLASTSGLYLPDVFTASAPMTWCVIGRSGDGDNGYLLGTDDATDYLSQQFGSDGISRSRIGNESLNLTETVTTYADGPMLLLASNNPEGAGETLLYARSATTELKNATEAGQAVGIAGTQLQIGGAGPSWSGSVSGGDIAEVLIFDAHTATDSGLLAALKAYTAARYGWS